MKELHLPCGKIALVSDEDWPRMLPFSWYDRGGGHPAARFKKSEGGHGRLMILKRFILNAPDGLEVDNLDNNPLNNQRENLQLATHSRIGMKTQRALRGGLYHRVEGSYDRWEARLRMDGTIVRLGSYHDEAEARAVLEAARKLAWSSHFNPAGIKLAP